MIEVNASQPYRKLYLVELSLAGSSMEVSAVQFANAPKLIVSDDVVSSSKFTVLSAVQPENALDEIISTDPGISTLCSPVQSLNALSPISVYPSGIVTPVILSFPSNALPTEVI